MTTTLERAPTLRARALAALHTLGEATTDEVAEAIGVDRRRIAATLSDMAREGKVARHRQYIGRDVLLSWTLPGRGPDAEGEAEAETEVPCDPSPEEIRAAAAALHPGPKPRKPRRVEPPVSRYLREHRRRRNPLVPRFRREPTARRAQDDPRVFTCHADARLIDWMAGGSDTYRFTQTLGECGVL